MFTRFILITQLLFFYSCLDQLSGTDSKVIAQNPVQSDLDHPGKSKDMDDSGGGNFDGSDTDGNDGGSDSDGGNGARGTSNSCDDSIAKLIKLPHSAISINSSYGTTCPTRTEYVANTMLILCSVQATPCFQFASYLEQNPQYYNNANLQINFLIHSDDLFASPTQVEDVYELHPIIYFHTREEAVDFIEKRFPVATAMTMMGVSCSEASDGSSDCEFLNGNTQITQKIEELNN